MQAGKRKAGRKDTCSCEAGYSGQVLWCDHWSFTGHVDTLERGYLGERDIVGKRIAGHLMALLVSSRLSWGMVF